MEKILDWYTVGEASYENFENSVLAKIKQGYQPHGNFILLPKGERNKYILLQPMVKYETPPTLYVEDFYIIGQTNYDDFDRSVINKIKEGFVPTGNSVIMHNPSNNSSIDWILMQVMVKYKV